MFIGSREIDKIEDGAVFFKDGAIHNGFSEKALAYLVTEEMGDDSEIQNKTYDLIAQEMLDVLVNYNFRFSDINSIWQAVQMSIAEYQDRVACKAAGVLDNYGGSREMQLRNIRIGDYMKFLNS